MTSYVGSICKPIERIQFNPLPSKRPVAGRLVRIDGIFVVVTDKGSVYSSQIKDHCFYSGGFTFNATIEACAKLGVISKADYEMHKAHCDARRAKQERKYAAASMRGNARLLGLKLTAKQKEILEVEMGDAT